MRYRIHPIADENCSSLNTDNLLAATDDLAEAERLADGHSNWPYGAGILDTHTGKIDVGAGFDDTETKYEEQFAAARELLGPRIGAAAGDDLDMMYQLGCSIDDALANEWQEGISTEEWAERAAKRVGI